MESELNDTFDQVHELATVLVKEHHCTTADGEYGLCSEEIDLIDFYSEAICLPSSSELSVCLP